MSNTLDRKLLIELLIEKKNSYPKEEVFKRARVQEQIELLNKIFYGINLENQGGNHLGEVRNWIQCKTVNGDQVTWGSHDRLELRSTLTVHVLETLACRVAAGALNDFLGHL